MNRRPWTDEFGPIINTLRILVRSQLGYQVRHIDFKGGNWTRERCQDLFGRAQTVAASIREITKLASRGIYPGAGGYTVQDTSLGSSSDLTHRTYEEVGSSNTSDNQSWKNDGNGSRKQAFENATLEINDVPRNGADIVSLVVPPKPKYDEPHLPKGYQLKTLEVEFSNTKNRERKVPSSRIARLAQFGQLGVSLVVGAAAEMSKRTLGFS
ncbi:unnamed protein product [Litomosoides sigmodontis]|uniref:Uncharacterized protein n=1 Tax=Litomosoides sigmodontis TaxID=42156 RepID=A0A3P7LXC1_LITSI|nr:unnamed protein product [Litomosoides sigmodontis]